MRTAYLPLFAVVVTTVGGCGGQSAPTTADQPPAAATAEQIQELRKEVTRLAVETYFLKSRVESLESGQATASTEEQGYDIARTKFGPFTVSTRGVTPYLDGFKVKLRVGNLTNADFNGAKLKLAWGPPFDGNSHEEWEKAQKKKEMSVTNRFASGSFTDVEVILTPAKPEEIKSFAVGFELDQLQLRVR